MSNKKHPEYQYLDILADIRKNGVLQIDKGTGVKTHSVFGRQIRFDLGEGFPLLTTKKVYWNGVLQEIYWFISGQTNIKYLVDNNVHIWDDYPFRYYKRAVKRGEVPELTREEFIEKIAGDNAFAKKWGELPRIYGEMWRKWPTSHGGTIDQLKWAVNECKSDPDNHNALVNSWNPEFLYEMARPDDASLFPVCHNMFQFNVKENTLSLQLYQRSADMFLGVPFNIASYALLTHVVAKVLGYKPGDFVHTFGDVHIYESHFDQVDEQLTRHPKSFPTVTIDSSVKELDDFRPEHVLLENYDSHPRIKGELAVVGGLYDDDHIEKKKV